MKNKYLTRFLCITLASATIISGSALARAAEGEAFVSGDSISDQSAATQEPAVPTPDVNDTSTPVPDSGQTAVPEENQGTVSPEGGETADPVPGESTDPAPGGEESSDPAPGGEGTTDPAPGPGSEETPSPAPGEEGTPSPTPGEEGTPTPTPGEEETPTPTPGEEEEPSPTPGEEGDPTPTPGEEGTPTPTPGEEGTPTPTPGEEQTPTPTPTPGEEMEMVISEAAQIIVDRIDALSLVMIGLEHEQEILEIRAGYDALSEEEKAQVTNYDAFVAMEAQLASLKTDLGIFSDEQPSETAPAVEGTPVYFTNMVSNLHAGKDFYLNNLKDKYQLTFSENFASVMEEIESEYRDKMKVADINNAKRNGVTSSEDMLLVRNWQDILAVYVYQQHEKGVNSFEMNESCKKDLAKIFEELNPIVRSKQNITQISYANRHINYYIKQHKIKKKEEREFLKKYVETDCKLLCATVTAAKGFVRESVGDDVSEERVNVISAAYSLVGQVGYFWGGKSTVIGTDPSWGSAAVVSAEGSPSTGTLRAYGLDCSGFVTWAVVNGYQNQAMEMSVGDGTSDQWVRANVVSEKDAQPGDLVFQRGPEAGSDNHVGIICGKTDAGDWIAVHCSSSKNGVTVGEAYSASFRYIRQPSFYPTKEELAAMEEENRSLLSRTEVVVSSEFEDVAKRVGDSLMEDSGIDGFTDMTDDAGFIGGDGSLEDSASDDVEVFMTDTEVDVFDGNVVSDAESSGIEVFGEDVAVFSAE